jgi:hypothetical protein
MGAVGGVGSPHQLTNCPWCGTKIDPGKHIKVEKYSEGACRTLIFCGAKFGQCKFSMKEAPGEGLPVMVVDEEIYRRLPSLLITTVDKFAQMPWNGSVQMLFGQVDGFCERHGFRSPGLAEASEELEINGVHRAKGNNPSAKVLPQNPLRPPDLIIQDELHLISGPLGTLVGLYETAIDRLCTWEVNGKKVRPKVVASTATIRNARDQLHALFLRRLETFPPNGLDIRDNFFSLQRQSSEKTPGRKYIGVCAPGRRLKVALIRVYVAFLSAGQVLFDKYGLDADPWMTLVGYFNSLRELGGMKRLVDDDVRTRLRKMQDRGLASRTLYTPDTVKERSAGWCRWASRRRWSGISIRRSTTCGFVPATRCVRSITRTGTGSPCTPPRVTLASSPRRLPASGATSISTGRYWSPQSKPPRTMGRRSSDWSNEPRTPTTWRGSGSTGGSAAALVDGVRGRGCSAVRKLGISGGTAAHPAMRADRRLPGCRRRDS